MIKGYFGTSVKMANGKYVESLPFAISRIGTKLYHMSAAEEPDESKEQRDTDYQILHSVQNDIESKEKTEREQGEIRERSARKKYDVNNNAPHAHRPP